MMRKKAKRKTYDKVNMKPILKCSICNGEQVAGFKDLRTGKFEEVALICSGKDLEAFKKTYGIEEKTGRTVPFYERKIPETDSSEEN